MAQFFASQVTHGDNRIAVLPDVADVAGPQAAQRQAMAPGRGDGTGSIRAAGCVPAEAAGIALERRQSAGAARCERAEVAVHTNSTRRAARAGGSASESRAPEMSCRQVRRRSPSDRRRVMSPARGIASENPLRLPVPTADGGGMLSGRDRAEFAERGVVWLRSAVGADEAAAMRRRVWARLARSGVTEDDPATWASADVTGLSRRVKRDRVFAARHPRHLLTRPAAGSKTITYGREPERPALPAR